MTADTIEISVDAQHQARIARALIKAAGGLESAAEITGKGKSQLARYQSPNEPDSITLEVVEALESVTHGTAGHPIVSRYLARQSGYSIFRNPVVKATGSDLLRLVADQAKEGGEVASAICIALADGSVDAKEVSAIRKELADLIRLAVTMDAELDFIEHSGE